MLIIIECEMRPLLKPYIKLPQTFFVAMIAAYAVLPHNVMAFDSQSVLKMHTSIETMQVQISDIPTNDVAALSRIKAVEAELLNLRARLQQYENKLTQTLTQNQLNDGQVLQRPLEDPYAASATAPANVEMTQALPEVKAKELNTVPEALRTSKVAAAPKPQAFAATPLPESGRVTMGQKTLVGSLGSQAADITAFNEAKGYFDDAYYVLSERKFNQFIQYYRKSSLISNAYFWLGESYYMRKNYGAAARVYYQGYRVNKKGSKAPDNLFKLATSLLLLGNKSDACAAYYEVGRRYSKSHPQLSSLAQSAQKEQACL